MRFSKRSAALVLFVSGAVLAGGNVWTTAARSTIPLALDTQVQQKETRHEKHPGADDVNLLKLTDGRTLHVDPEVYRTVREGEHLQKAAGERTLLYDDRELALTWSVDFRGMCWTMPLAMGLCAALTLVALFRSTYRSEE